MFFLDAAATATPTPAPLQAGDVTTAITNALVQGGSTWLIATVVAFLPVMWTMTLMFHIGRPYFLRILGRLGIRFGADVWWMSYVLLRDALMVITFGMSWVFFEPNLVTTLAFPTTAPLAALLLLLTLVVKITTRVDDDPNAYRLATALLVAGATLYYFPMAFIIEAGSQSSHFGGLPAWFTSSVNTDWSLRFMWIAIIGMVLAVGYLFVRATVKMGFSKTATPSSQRV